MIRLSRTAHDELRLHAEACWPQESCGVLLGRAAGGGRVVTLALACRNVHPEPARRYELDARELLSAMRLARRRGEEIVGFYHSHPRGPARPSAVDLDEAWWPGCAYLITAVDGGRAGATRAFLLAGDGGTRRFDEEPVEREPAAEAGASGR